MYMWCADGYYRAGTHAAEMAKTKGIRALQVEKQRKDAEEEQRRKQQVSQRSALPHMCPCSCTGKDHDHPAARVLSSPGVAAITTVCSLDLVLHGLLRRLEVIPKSADGG